ncbi:hypothetical protein Tco_1529482, partial [Tanacetum coccineum]
WFKEKMMLAQALESGVVLDEEQIAFLADPGDRVDSGPDTQTMPTAAIFQTDDLDAFDSDCDEAPSTSVVFMTNLSAYESDFFSDVPIQDTYHDNFVLNHCVQEIYYSEQLAVVNDSNIEISSDNNVISYDQYLKENESEVVQTTTSPEQQNAMIMFVIYEMSNQVAKCNATNQENKVMNESLTAELE